MAGLWTNFRPLQEEIRTPAIFLERTDQLAARLGVSLRSLAPMMGLSVASLFGYRNGSIPISTKAWLKLEQAELGGSTLREDPTPYRAPLYADEQPKPQSDLVTAAQNMEQSMHIMMQELAAMRLRIETLEEIIKKGPTP